VIFLGFVFSQPREGFFLPGLSVYLATPYRAVSYQGAEMSDAKDRSKPLRPDALDFYTVAETALILGVSQKLVFTWIKDGVLPAIRLGPGQRLIRVRRVDLETFVETEFQPSVPPGKGGSLRREAQG
jgi:excisionase family DNA binding protein